MSAAAIANPRRVWRVVAIMWIFIIVGPPVGTMFFMLLTALLGMGKGADLAGLSWVALLALIYGLPFGYFIGIWPAAATGLAVGIRQVYFGGAKAMVRSSCRDSDQHRISAGDRPIHMDENR